MGRNLLTAETQRAQSSSFLLKAKNENLRVLRVFAVNKIAPINSLALIVY